MMLPRERRRGRRVRHQPRQSDVPLLPRAEQRAVQQEGRGVHGAVEPLHGLEPVCGGQVHTQGGHLTAKIANCG